MNKLYYGDNLDIMRKHITDESVDLCYIDPPFNSNKDYNIIYDGSTAQATAFTDVWSKEPPAKEEEYIMNHIEDGKYAELYKVLKGLKMLLEKNNPALYSYLTNIGIRIVEIHRVLKDTGSFYLHCDPTASHYIKIMLDAVFGPKNFRNEIVWFYPSVSATKSGFPQKHDIILRYSKGDAVYFNGDAVREAYDEKTVSRYKNKVIFPGGYEAKINPKGRLPYDVWKIPMLRNVSKERTGYPTQKPLALLERIIKSSCPPDGIVLDAYAGCATTCVAAQKSNRQWVGIDITYLAINVIKERLLKEFYYGLGIGAKEANRKLNNDTIIFGVPKDIEGARALARETKGDRVRKEFEKWAVSSIGGIPHEKKGGDGGTDGELWINEFTDAMKINKISIPISVKSDERVVPSQIRDLRGVIERDNSPMGIFISLEEISDGCKVEAKQKQYKNNYTNQVYPQIVSITAQEIIDGTYKSKLPIVEDIAPQGKKKAVKTQKLA